MSTIISNVLNGIGTAMKWTVGGAVVSLVCVGSFAYATKPEDAKLHDRLQERIEDDGLGGNKCLVSRGVSYLAEKTYKTDIKDYVFCKIADVTAPDGSKSKFIGVAQNWCPLNHN